MPRVLHYPESGHPITTRIQFLLPMSSCYNSCLTPPRPQQMPVKRGWGDLQSGRDFLDRDVLIGKHGFGGLNVFIDRAGGPPSPLLWLCGIKSGLGALFDDQTFKLASDTKI